MKDSGLTKLTATGPSEPDADELSRRRAQIMDRVQALEPDQLRDFAAVAATDDVSGDAKLLWEKTIWAK